MTEERWRPIEGFPGYEVSDAGRVGSFLIGKWKILTPRTVWANKRVNCLQVTLTPQAGKKVTFRVHTLVLTAFIGPRPHGMEGCHGDGDATNNRLGNIRWDTHTENMADSIRHGVMRVPRPRHPKLRLSEDDVRCIRAEPEAHGVGTMLAKAFGISPSHVSGIRSGRFRKYDGWTLLGAGAA